MAILIMDKNLVMIHEDCIVYDKVIIPKKLQTEPKNVLDLMIL